MITVTIALFGLAAVFGLILLIRLFSKKDLPRPMVYTHGALAATGLVILVVYALQHPENYPMISLILFIVAALGGFVLFFNDLKKKPGPAALAVIHALAAVAAFLLLILFVLA